MNQYGRLRGLSTTHALVDMVHTWVLACREKEIFTRGPFGLRKAFDHVDHTVIVNKCKTYDLHNFIIRWLCAFCQIGLRGWDLVRNCLIGLCWRDLYHKVCGWDPSSSLYYSTIYTHRVPSTSTWMKPPSQRLSRRRVLALCNRT